MDRRGRALLDLEAALRALTALLARERENAWHGHFTALLEEAAAVRRGGGAPEDLTRLSASVLSYFHARDAGFDLFLATSADDELRDAAARVASSALGLRVVGDAQ